jgi:hypothetical protein
MLSHHKQAALGCGTPNSSRSFRTHITSVAAFANALYSASVLDLDAVACLRATQEIRFDPKKIANPPVDRRSFGQPAQSASVNALTRKEADLLIFNP